jgi:hypothetical protein
VLLGVAALWPPVPAAVAVTRVTQEYDLKAVFLLNFARFVDWPDEAFSDPQAPIVIGVLGQNPFGGALQEAVENETAHDRRLVVRQCQLVEELEACHILFVPASELVRWAPLAGRVTRKSLLTVGESRAFAIHSGIIGFDVSGRKLRMSINLLAANAARLTISSKLLRQAHIIASEDIDP